MLLEIVTHPDPRLRQRSLPVPAFDQEVADLITNMFETMYAAPGVGLAAPQVGVLKRVLVIDLLPDGVTTDEDRAYLEELRGQGYPGPVALVNPEIVAGDGELCWNEGCLSLPELQVEITRRERVTVTGLGRDGRPVRYEASGFFAVALQHEIDHLEGKLIIDQLPPLRQAAITRRLKRLKQHQQQAQRVEPRA